MPIELITLSSNILAFSALCLLALEYAWIHADTIKVNCITWVLFLCASVFQTIRFFIIVETPETANFFDLLAQFIITGLIAIIARGFVLLLNALFSSRPLHPFSGKIIRKWRDPFKRASHYHFTLESNDGRKIRLPVSFSDFSRFEVNDHVLCPRLRIGLLGIHFFSGSQDNAFRSVQQFVKGGSPL